MTSELRETNPVAFLAEHLCARRPCGEAPENVTDWLAYSLDRCGLVLVTEQRLTSLVTRHPAPLSEENVESSDHPAFEAICDEISRFAPEVSTGMRGFLAARIIMQMLAQPAPQSPPQGGSN